jgi:NAD(P)-dependent dehydrogenase (short-subunit alcohol dehydrogenase family)/acyl carrier protein
MGQSIYATAMDLDRHWVLSEHRMLNEAIVPGTTYLEMARAAAEDHAGRPVTRIRDVDFLVPMLVEDGQPRTLHVTVRGSAAPDIIEFTVVSQETHDTGSGSWIVHAKGVLECGELAPIAAIDVDALRTRCSIETMDVGKGQIEHRVMAFGPRWHGSLQTVYSGSFEALGRLDLPDEYHLEDQGYRLHPALLDLATGFSGFASLDAATTDRANAKPVTDFFLPVGYDRIDIFRAIPNRGYSHIRPRSESDVQADFRKVDATIMDDDGVVAIEISGFAVKRISSAERTVQDLRPVTRHYGVAWKPAPRTGALVARDVLVVAAPGTDTTDMCAEARRHGATVVSIDAATGDDATAAYVATLTALDRVPDHVVYVAAGAGADAHRDLDRLETLLDGGLYSLFGLAKALDTADARPAALTVIASATSAITGTEPAIVPANAALFGLAKVLGRESEGLVARCVDIEGEVPVASLVAELFAVGAPALVGLRGETGRYQPELRSVDLRREADSPLGNGAVVLVTGGYGGLGLAVARHVSEQTAGTRIALVGRQGLPPRDEWQRALAGDESAVTRAIRAVQRMEEAGAIVECFRGDVSSPTDMARVVAEVRATLGPVACVVHAAGIAGDGFVFRKDPAVFRRTVAPKVLGATVLDIATIEDAPLMVLFGSTSAVFGVAGQSDYTAANGYLDAFAEFRAAQGRPTIAIDWTDWLETGMAFDHGVHRDQGFFRSITVDDGVASFMQALRAMPTRVIVGDINYDMLAALPPAVLEEQLARSPLGLSNAIYQRIRSTRPAPSAADGRRPSAPAGSVRLTGRDSGAYSPTEEAVARIWAQELGLDEVNVFENSFDIGGDSLTALRMATGIQLTLGMRVTIIDLFRYTTVADLAEHLDQLPR